MPTIELTPLSEFGADVLNEFEEDSGAKPYAADAKGARSYAYASSSVPVAFDSLLNGIDPTWIEHIQRRLTGRAGSSPRSGRRPALFLTTRGAARVSVRSPSLRSEGRCRPPAGLSQLALPATRTGRTERTWGRAAANHPATIARTHVRVKPGLRQTRPR